MNRKSIYLAAYKAGAAAAREYSTNLASLTLPESFEEYDAATVHDVKQAFYDGWRDTMDATMSNEVGTSNRRSL